MNRLTNKAYVAKDTLLFLTFYLNNNTMPDKNKSINNLRKRVQQLSYELGLADNILATANQDVYASEILRDSTAARHLMAIEDLEDALNAELNTLKELRETITKPLK